MWTPPTPPPHSTTKPNSAAPLHALRSHPNFPSFHISSPPVFINSFPHTSVQPAVFCLSQQLTHPVFIMSILYPSVKAHHFPNFFYPIIQIMTDHYITIYQSCTLRGRQFNEILRGQNLFLMKSRRYNKL